MVHCSFFRSISSLFVCSYVTRTRNRKIIYSQISFHNFNSRHIFISFWYFMFISISFHFDWFFLNKFARVCLVVDDGCSDGGDGGCGVDVFFLLCIYGYRQVFFLSLLFNFCYTHILFPCLLFSVCVCVACVCACVCLVFNTVFVFTNRHSVPCSSIAFSSFEFIWRALCVFFTLAQFRARVCVWVWVFTLSRDINKCVAHTYATGTHEHTVFCTRHQIDGASKWRPIQTRKLKFSTEFKCHSFFGIVYIFIGICMHVWVCASVSIDIHHYHTFGCGV